MRYMVLLAITCVVLVGCGTPQITIPVGQASIFYAQVRSDYSIAKVVVSQACAGGKIDKASCDALAAIDVRTQTLRQAVERSLMDASAPVDWGQVLSYAASVSEMLVRLGLLAAK